MKRLSLLAVFLTLAASAQADSFTTIDGDSYPNVTVKRVEPDGIVVADTDGVHKLKFKNLPAAIGAKYGYDPAKASQFQSALQQSAIAAQAQEAQIQAEQQALIASATPEPKPVAIHSSALLPTASSSHDENLPTSFKLDEGMVRTGSSSARLSHGEWDYTHLIETFHIVSVEKGGVNVTDSKGAERFIDSDRLPSEIKKAYGFR